MFLSNIAELVGYQRVMVVCSIFDVSLRDDNFFLHFIFTIPAISFIYVMVDSCSFSTHRTAIMAHRVMYSISRDGIANHVAFSMCDFRTLHGYHHFEGSK